VFYVVAGGRKSHISRLHECVMCGVLCASFYSVCSYSDHA